MKLKNKGLLASAIVASLVLGGAASADAYWYNSTVNTGKLSIQVRNTANHYFYIAGGRGADDINLAVAGWGERLTVQSGVAVWTKCFPKGGTMSVPAKPLDVVYIKKTKC